MNEVVLVGRLDENPVPWSRAGEEGSLLRILVRRRRSGGSLEPGVVGLEVFLPRSAARHGAGELQAGNVVALSGLIDREEWRDGDQWRSRHEIVADWVESLGG